MSHWFPVSLLCMTCWALWAFLAKVAGKWVTEGTISVCAAIGAASAIPLYAWLFRNSFQWNPRSPGVWLAFSAGLLGSLGGVLFYLAMSRAQAQTARVVGLTSVYPVITTILAAVILREHPSPRECAGILLAIAGMCLLAK